MMKMKMPTALALAGAMLVLPGATAAESSLPPEPLNMTFMGAGGDSRPRVFEFTPKGDPTTLCVVLTHNSSMGGVALQCWKKEPAPPTSSPKGAADKDISNPRM